MIRWVKRIITFHLTMVVSITYALPQDKESIVYLHAGSASLNQSTHSGIYTHFVAIDQGTTHLRADKAETKTNEKNQLIFAIAKGNETERAHVWTLSEKNKPPVHSYADIIRYYPMEHRVELTGHAEVIQGDNAFKAPHILYDTLTQHVVTKPEGNERTTIIFNPSHS
jgi:lipopolysaccharide export system protein LptA